MNQDKKMAIIGKFLLNFIIRWQKMIKAPIKDTKILEQLLKEIREIETDVEKYQIKKV